MRPAPVFYFGKIIAVFGYIELVALNFLGVPLARRVDLRCESWDTRNGIERQLEAVNIVEHAHIEGRGRGALLLVAAHMDVVVVVTPVGEAVNQPWITVECEDHRNADREQQIEVLVGRMAGNDWVRTRDRFELRRPSSVDPDEVAQSVQGEVGPGGR